MAFDEIDIRQLDARLLQITQLLTEIRDALKPPVVDKPSTTEPPIPPPVRLEEWERAFEGWDNRPLLDCCDKQIAHLRARKERGEDV